MKPYAADKLKSKIILDVMDLQKQRDDVIGNRCVENITIFAKHYGIQLKKAKINQEVMQIDKALRSFILNQEGYPTTINNLYNALIK